MRAEMKLRNAVGWIKEMVLQVPVQSPYLDGGHVRNLEIVDLFALLR